MTRGAPGRAPGAGEEKAAVLAGRPSASSPSRRSASAVVAAAEPGSVSTMPATISSRGGRNAASGIARPSNTSSRSSSRGATSRDLSGAGVSLAGRPGAPPVRSRCGIVLQDRLLKPLELLARFEPKLLRQLAAGGSVGVERLGLARRPVERQHQLVAQALPEWMSGDQALELASKPRVATTSEVGVDPLLGRRPAPAPRAWRSRSGRRAS